MTHIQLDYGKTLEFFGQHELDQQKDIVKTIHKTIHEGTGAGSDFLGWVNLPEDYDKEEFLEFKKQQNIFNRIQMYWWLSELAVHI